MKVVKDISFNNANSYRITGAGLILEDGVTEDPTPVDLSTIEVLQGDHEFQLPVTLANDTDVTLATGSSLAFNNALNLGGNTLTKSGAGTMSVNNVLTTGGGSIVVAAGLLGGDGTVVGSLIVDAAGTVAPGRAMGD